MQTNLGATQRKQLRVHQRISFQLLAAFFALFLLFFAALGYGLYLAEQRERDQAVLNTAARMELVTRMMEHQALNYVSTPARDYTTYFRDVRLYYQNLRSHVDTFDEALGCFASGRFSLEHGGRGDSGIFKYDTVGRPSVERSVSACQEFRGGLELALGDDDSEPRLEYAAQFVLENVGGLEEAVSALNADLQQAARTRLDVNRYLNRAVVVGAIVLLGITLWWARRMLRPLDEAVHEFERVAQGEFGHKVQLITNNEIGLMVDTFNSMNARLQALFRLMQKIQEARDLKQTLQSIVGELGRFICLDWAGILLVDAERMTLRTVQSYTAARDLNVRHGEFPMQGSGLLEVLDGERLLRIPDLALATSETPEACLECVLKNEGLSTAMVLPIRSLHQTLGLLVLASRLPYSYQLEQEELVNNLGSVLTQGLRKTMAIECGV